MSSIEDYGMDSYFIKELIRQDLQDFMDFFGRFPEESDQSQSPPAKLYKFIK